MCHFILTHVFRLALRYVDALANAKLSSLAKRKAVERREELARKSNADEKEKLKEIREVRNNLVCLLATRPKALTSLGEARGEAEA